MQKFSHKCVCTHKQTECVQNVKKEGIINNSKWFDINILEF